MMLPDQAAVPDVAEHELDAPAAQGSGEVGLATADEIIHHDDPFAAGRQQLVDDVRTDEPRAAGDQRPAA